MAHSQDEPAWQKVLKGQSQRAFDEVKRARNGRRVEEQSLSKAREQDGPLVAEKRQALRDVERKLSRPDTPELRPDGGRRADRQQLLQQRDEMRKDLGKIDKVRQDFDERGDKNRRDR